MQKEVPCAALRLESGRRLLALSPATAWFYRAAGIAAVASLTELYALLLQGLQGMQGLRGDRRALGREDVEFIKRKKLLLHDTDDAKLLAAHLSGVPVQHDRDGVLRPACQLVDCRVPFLATVFAVPPPPKPSKDQDADAKMPVTGPGAKRGACAALLPREAVADKNTMAFLGKLGLRSSVADFAFLVVCARSLRKRASARATD